MQGSWLDHIPSLEREKIRKRMRSPEAYETLREKVKDPEDLERELKRSATLAELHFSLESDPRMQESLKSQVERDMNERGIEAVVDDPDKLNEDTRNALMQGNFTVCVSPHPKTSEDTVAVAPEGNVQEAIPLRPQIGEQYAGIFLQKSDNS